MNCESFCGNIKRQGKKKKKRDRARKQIGFPIPAFLRKQKLSREPGLEVGYQT